MSYFSLPLLQWQQQQSILTSRKRKSTSGGFESDYPESEDAQSTADESAPNASTAVKLSSRRDGIISDVSQHRVAGLDPDEPVPRPPFPHAPGSNGRTGRRKHANSEEALQSMNPPLYLPESFARGGSLRMQHFAVISTILHRCLLEGDYVRASRAWGMILRDEFGGFAVDPRADGRWGIGAEILLHRDTQAARERQATIATASHGLDSETTAKATPTPWFTREGFQAAQDYYERLILQYPFHRSYAKSTSELDFYPAMFGLWIYIAQAERSIARELLEFDLSDNAAKLHAEAEALVRRELKVANAIGNRLDEVMTHPPYSDYGELLRLRGMVALWVGDLQASQEESGSKEVGADSSVIETDREEASSRKKRESILLAKRFFEEAKRRGVELPRSIESLWDGDDEDMPDE